MQTVSSALCGACRTLLVLSCALGLGCTSPSSPDAVGVHAAETDAAARGPSAPSADAMGRTALRIDAGATGDELDASGFALRDAANSAAPLDANTVLADASGELADAARAPTDSATSFDGGLPALADQTPPVWTNGIAIDELGYLWIADQFGAQLLRLSPDRMRIVGRFGASAGVSPFVDDLVLDNEFVYWTGMLGEVGKLSRQSGQSVTLASTGLGTNPIAFGLTGKLLVGRAIFGTGLFELDPSGQQPMRTVVADSRGINAFAVAPDGCVYGPADGAIVKLELANGTLSTFQDGFALVGAVRYNALDGLLYGLEASSPPRLFRIALDKSGLSTFATLSAGDNSIDNFAIAKDGTFYVTRFTEPMITRVSRDGLQVEDFAIGK